MSETIVPLMNGCACPMIKEFRHVHSESKRKEYSLPAGCFDIHTKIPAGIDGHHVVFRNCICNHPSGLCTKLPPLMFPLTEEQVASFENDDEDEDDDSDFGNWGATFTT